MFIIAVLIYFGSAILHDLNTGTILTILGKYERKRGKAETKANS